MNLGLIGLGTESCSKGVRGLERQNEKVKSDIWILGLNNLVRDLGHPIRAK
jgi:hypothetical protein